ncbi:MAG: PAS domain S-box protein, partial [Polyangiaceae bacterium]
MSASMTERRSRILVVDDERNNRSLLDVMLAPEGYLVVCASSGEEALAMLDQQLPDLILLDVMMPGLNGYQLAEKLKANLATRNIPIIMVTVRDDREAKMRGLRAGAEDFLSKPVDRAELCVRVRNLLRLKAYGDYHDRYGQMLEDEVGSRAADLVESARVYRETFDAALDAIVGMDDSGKITEFNPAAERAFGYSRQEALGRVFEDLIVPQRTREILGKVIEVTARRRDGTVFPVELAITQIRPNPSARFMSFIRDVSERKRAEARYQHIVETTNQGVWMIDLEGRTTFMNTRMANMLGYQSEEVVGLSALAFIAEESREVAVQAIRERSGRAFQVERKLQRKDGSTLWALLEVAPSIGGSGKCDGSYAMVIDITERKKAEEDLLERVRIAALGAEVSMALAMGDALPDTLRQCAQAMVSHLGVALAGIWMLNPRDNVLELRASAGMDIPEAHKHVPFAKHKIGLIAEERQAHFTNDLANDPRTMDPTWARSEGLVSFAGHPLLVAGQLIGVVAMYARQPFTEAV